MQDRPLYDITKTIGYQFSKIAQLYTQRLDEELADCGLTGQSWLVLLAITEMRINRPSQIADYLTIKRASLSRTLAELEKNGWIARETDAQDARARAVVVTKAGRMLYFKALPRTVSVSTYFRQKMSLEQFEDLRKILDTLLEDETDEPSSPVRYIATW